MGGGKLHLFRDLNGASLQRTLKDAGEGNHIVDLVREVGTSCPDYSCTGGFGGIGHDLRHRISHGEEDGIRLHGSYHIGCYDIGGRDAYENISAL